jgi:hypothetical protein
MALSNAERQRLCIQRLNAKAVVSNKERAPAVSNGDDLKRALVSHLSSLSPTDACLFLTGVLSDLNIDWPMLPDCSVQTPQESLPPPEPRNRVALKALRKRAGRLGFRVRRRKGRLEIEPSDGGRSGSLVDSIADAHKMFDIIDGTTKIRSITTSCGMPIRTPPERH